MARSRNIKPGFFKNEDLAELHPLARILFAGLWCLADREGRLEDRPKRIKSEVLPYDECDIDKLLDDLNNAGFIVRYQIADKKYVQVIEFKTHQNPHKKEAASVIPPLTEQASEKHMERTVLVPGNTGTSPADSFNLIPDSLNLIPDSPIKDIDEEEEENAREEITEPEEKFPPEPPEEISVVRSFEKEFGRPLTPIELEHILKWQEDYDKEVIILALKQAVISGARRFRYIDSILLDWEKNCLTSVHEIEDHMERFKDRNLKVVTGSGSRNKGHPQQANKDKAEYYS